MRLLTYNILDGGVGRIDPIAEVIRLADADIVVVQEADDAEQFHKLADRLHMDRFMAENPRPAGHAVGLLTRWEIREVVNLAAVYPAITRSALNAAILPPAGDGSREPWHVLGMHLHARETFADEEIRLREIDAIIAAAASLPPAHLLAGDFNTSHPEQQIDHARLRQKSKERIAGQNNELPREVIRRVLSRGYVDAHAVGRAPAQFDTSFTTSHAAMRVDFVFASPALAHRVQSCIVFKPEMARFASDHFPVLAEFV